MTGQNGTGDAGSYDYSRFSKSDEEMQRLKMQATVALSLEKKIWTDVGLREGMRVLDLACGPGFISCELARTVGSGAVVGVDISEDLIATAGQVREAEKVQNVTFSTGDVYALDLPEDSFDFVYARFLFQHLRDPDTVLENIVRVLKPGGILCVVDIDDNWTSFFPESEAFIRFIRKAGAAQGDKGGNRMIGSHLYGLLGQAGFREVSASIYPVTTEELGVRIFLGVAVLFRMQLLSRFQKLLALPQLKRIKAAAQDPNAWGALGIFAVTGVKGRGPEA